MSLARRSRPDPVQQLVGALGALPLLPALPGQPEHGRDRAGLLPGLDADLDVLQRGQRREQPDVLERPGHPELVDHVGLQPDHAGRRVTGPGPDLDGALLRRVDAGEGVEQRGLAGAVRADHGQDLAAVHLQRHLVQAGHAAEAQGDVADVEDHVVAGGGRLALVDSGSHAGLTSLRRPAPRPVRSSPWVADPPAPPRAAGPGSGHRDGRSSWPAPPRRSTSAGRRPAPGP